jgi:F0F1-type ATP synthase membrane subunit b/b'
MAEETPKILTKPLPQILDEMDVNIKLAAEAVRRAEEAASAAKGAKEAAEAATKEAIRKAEEMAAGARQIAEATNAEAMKNAENALREVQESLMSTIVKKVISSWEMLIIIAVVFLGAVLASIAIGVGLGFLGR